MELRVFIRYKHYDILSNRFRDVDDCFADSIKMFKEHLLKYSGLAGAVGYGKNVRPDLKAWIILEWKENGALILKEFPDVFLFTDFLRKNNQVAKKLNFTPAKNSKLRVLWPPGSFKLA
jgi:hypothetical protein